MSSWRPTAELELLQARSDLLWRLRSFFRNLDFVEVQTPTLSHESVIDRHLEPISVPAAGVRLSSVDSRSTSSLLYLQTSPEFGMKRLVAAGMQQIYQICPAFRAGERGALHNPEFTMVEWYRVGDQLEQAIGLLGQLILSISEFKSIEHATYQEAFEKHAGCNPLTASLQELKKLAAEQMPVDSTFSNERDDWLQLIFDGLVQPQLGHSSPRIISKFPASQAALAKVSPENPHTCERFELFLCGIELANGYHELTDADELVERNRAANEARRRDGKQELPENSHLVKAMQAGLPDCSGCALGLDRLLMVLTKAKNISDVIAFPIERC